MNIYQKIACWLVAAFLVFSFAVTTRPVHITVPIRIVGCLHDPCAPQHLWQEVSRDE